MQMPSVNCDPSWPLGDGCSCWRCNRLLEQDKVTADRLQAYRDWCPGVGIDEKQYQLQGIKWCLYHELAEKPNAGVRGGIIADEMGLGKTILMIACIRHNFKARTLVVLPPALLQQWVGVFQRFLGHTPFVYRGSKAKNVTVEELMQMPVVITTYGMISPRVVEKDSLEVTYSKLHKVEWSRIIYDEAHHLRNLKTKVHDGACKLKADIRWMVTGTPINNKLNDLYALCKVLGLAKVFTPKKEEIKLLMGIHLLRRTKDQVGINLPPVKTQVVEVDWSSDAERDTAEDIHSMLHFTTINKNNVDEIIAWLNRHPLAAFTRARQMCIYPQLLHKAVKKMKRKGIIPQDMNLKDIKTSSKITSVVDHIVGNRQTGKRKLVFCHYRGEIDVLTEKLSNTGMTVQSIDGRTKTRNKKQRILSVVSEPQFRSVCKTWNALPEEMFGVINSFLAPEVMIVQIQTACEGLNMQHFQEIYFTSPHWNPAVEDQAVARAHRIGQEKSVDVYRFVMNGFGRNSISFEQYCSHVQDIKREVMQILN
jgi:transcription termination factor 2